MKQISTIILLNILITSCNIYSFTGASIPSQAKSIFINQITTETNSPSILNQVISEGLKDLCLSQTGLSLTDSEGDLNFSGKITKYEIKPMAIQANETAGKDRLTIEIIIKYQNRFDSNQNFESKFSRYRDFSSSENLSEIELNLIEEISKEILEDVFNKAFVNW
jgi:hypothetical protein